MKSKLLLFFCSIFFAQVNAGGIILYEMGTADLRLASAGYSARAQDPSTLFTNPAGMARLCDKQLELGLQPIYCHAHFEPNSETNVKGSQGHANIWLPAGSFFYVHPCTENLTVGFGSLGYFGSDLVYNHDWVGRYYCQKALMEALSLVPAASYRLSEEWSIGAGVNVMYAFFRQRAAINNVVDGLDDGYFTLRDYQFSCGGVFGILYEPTCTTRLGVQYLTPVRINFSNTPHFHDLGPILEAVLTRLGVIGSKALIHINVPQSVMFSIYHDLNPCWSIMGNLGWQQWSRFQRVTFALADENSTSITSKVKYEDTWHAALGLEWHYDCDLTFSGGIAYDSSCISNKERPLDFPVGKQWRFGTGARWNINESFLMDVAAELLWQGDLKADVNIGPLAGHVSGVFKNTACAFFSASFIYRF
jgi:long-chain fatty acid transport protein